MNGSWKDNKFYLHFTINLTNSKKSQLFYRHFLAFLDLDTLKWTEINSNQYFYTKIPMKMTVTNDDVLVFVQSLDARYVREQEKSFKDVKGLDPSLLKSKNAFCCANRIPLR